jgi:hypothetical protein
MLEKDRVSDMETIIIEPTPKIALFGADSLIRNEVFTSYYVPIFNAFDR